MLLKIVPVPNGTNVTIIMSKNWPLINGQCQNIPTFMLNPESATLTSSPLPSLGKIISCTNSDVKITSSTYLPPEEDPNINYGKNWLYYSA